MSVFSKLILLLACTLMISCGFKLRGSQVFNFKTIGVVSTSHASVVQDLKKQLMLSTEVLSAGDDLSKAEYILEISYEKRERQVTGFSTSGSVKDLKIGCTVAFSFRTHTGRTLISNVEISRQKNIGFNETQALSKALDEDAIYVDLKADIVRQILKRLSVVSYAAQS